MPNLRWVFAAVGLWLGPLAQAAFGASAPASQAGGPYSIDVWQTDDGLPQNSVIAMTQTRDGYLWLGTLNGLVRFDGTRFTVFDESNTPGLTSSRIVSLFEDRPGNLWIGTETAGIVIAKDGRVTSLGIGQGTRDGRLAAACEDASGAVWLYTMHGQLWRYRNGATNAFLVDADRPSSCRALISESSGALWVGTDGQLSRIEPTAASDRAQLPIAQSLAVGKLDFLLTSQRGGFWRLAEGRVQKWHDNRLERDLGPYPWDRVPVTAACEDRDGNLLVGTRGSGVFRYDATGQVANLSTQQGLSYNYILSLLVDREGNLWVGTDGGGLNRVKRPVFEVLEASRGQVAQSVAEDAQGGIWVGYNGGGVDHWRDGLLERFGPSQGLINLPIRSVFVDRQDGLWVGTWGAGLLRLQKGGFPQAAMPEAITPVILAIHQDRTGRLWVGTRGGLVRWDEHASKVFTTREGLSADVIRALADDAEGNLWIGTEGGGLNRMRDGKFTSVPLNDGLPSQDISSLYVDTDGTLWVGTFGLARLRDGRWTRYTTRSGLISNSVGYLVDDGLGYLWIGSNAGLMRVPKKALTDFAAGRTNFIPCRTYGKSDGLPTRECTLGSQPGAVRTREGKLWFPTIKGLVSVNPELLNLNPNTKPPPVRIESVLIDGQEQNTNSLRAVLPQSLVIPAGRERLEIQYTSLNLAAPDRARFKYRLEGHETDWIEAGTTRVARYSRLPPGQYRFQVTACNEDGVWSESGSTLILAVAPPFWKTRWFLGGSAAGLLGAVIAIVYYLATQRLKRQVETLRQKETLEKERSRIARDLHDQLGANLTQVALLGELVESDKNAPDEVEAHAQQISQTARETTRALDEIVWAVNPSNDSLDGLINYACKYAQEYLAIAGLRYRLEVPPQLPNIGISPEVRHNVFLAFKEAVTNVVRHAHASEGRIRLHMEPKEFTLEIEDNGRGLAGADSPAAQMRNGLRNMRKRMEDIGGRFAIGPAPEGGAQVRLTAPLGTDLSDRN